MVVLLPVSVKAYRDNMDFAQTFDKREATMSSHGWLCLVAMSLLDVCVSSLAAIFSPFPVHLCRVTFRGFWL